MHRTIGFETAVADYPPSNGKRFGRGISTVSCVPADSAVREAVVYSDVYTNYTSPIAGKLLYAPSKR